MSTGIAFTLQVEAQKMQSHPMLLLFLVWNQYLELYVVQYY